MEEAPCLTSAFEDVREFPEFDAVAVGRGMRRCAYHQVTTSQELPPHVQEACKAVERASEERIVECVDAYFAQEWLNIFGVKSCAGEEREPERVADSRVILAPELAACDLTDERIRAIPGGKGRVKLYGVRSDSTFKKLGVNNADAIAALDGTHYGDVDRLTLSAAAALALAGKLSVTILRYGKEVPLHLRVEE